MAVQRVVSRDQQVVLQVCFPFAGESFDSSRRIFLTRYGRSNLPAIGDRADGECLGIHSLTTHIVTTDMV
jgi:hypothetical protein